MNNFNPAVRRLNESFREHCLSTISELHLKQEVLADATRHNQSQVSRWFSYTGTEHFPAYLIPALNIPELKDFHFEMLRFLSANSDIEIRKTVGKVVTNGQLDDEIAGIVKALGSIQTCLEKNPEKRVTINGQLSVLEKLIYQLKEECERIAQ